MSRQTEPTFDVKAAHEHFARSLHGEAWSLLEQEPRSPEEDERMVHAAHASAYHWLHAGTARHRQRGAWLISRVHAVLGHAEESLRYALLAKGIVDGSAREMEDFDFAFAEEALARAHAAGGSAVEAAKHRGQAAELGGKLRDEEDRKIFLEELERGPWFGVD